MCERNDKLNARHGGCTSYSSSSAVAPATAEEARPSRPSLETNGGVCQLLELEPVNCPVTGRFVSKYSHRYYNICFEYLLLVLWLRLRLNNWSFHSQYTYVAYSKLYIYQNQLCLWLSHIKPSLELLNATKEVTKKVCILSISYYHINFKYIK